MALASGIACQSMYHFNYQVRVEVSARVDPFTCSPVVFAAALC